MTTRRGFLHCSISGFAGVFFAKKFVDTFRYREGSALWVAPQAEVAIIKAPHYSFWAQRGNTLVEVWGHDYKRVQADMDLFRAEGLKWTREIVTKPMPSGSGWMRSRLEESTGHYGFMDSMSHMRVDRPFDIAHRGDP